MGNWDELDVYYEESAAQQVEDDEMDVAEAGFLQGYNDMEMEV